jgi:hypothetical protein
VCSSDLYAIFAIPFYPLLERCERITTLRRKQHHAHRDFYVDEKKWVFIKDKAGNIIGKYYEGAIQRIIQVVPDANGDYTKYWNAQMENNGCNYSVAVKHK